MASEKVFLEVARKLLAGAGLGSGGSRDSAPVGVQGRSLRKFFDFAAYFEHGLQFRFNEITYFLEHYFIG